MKTETVFAECTSRKDILHGFKLVEFYYIYDHDGNQMDYNSFNVITEDSDLHLAWKIEQTQEYNSSEDNFFCTWKNIVLEKCNKENVYITLQLLLVDDSGNCLSLLNAKFDKISLPIEEIIEEYGCKKDCRLIMNTEILYTNQSPVEMKNDLKHLL